MKLVRQYTNHIFKNKIQFKKLKFLHPFSFMGMCSYVNINCFHFVIDWVFEWHQLLPAMNDKAEVTHFFTHWISKQKWPIFYPHSSDDSIIVRKMLSSQFSFHQHENIQTGVKCRLYSGCGRTLQPKFPTWPNIFKLAWGLDFSKWLSFILPESWNSGFIFFFFLLFSTQ